MKYPFLFRLDDGSSVIVNTANTIVYQFDVTEANGNAYRFEWHVFRGKEDHSEKQVKVLDAYTAIMDAQRVAVH